MLDAAFKIAGLKACFAQCLRGPLADRMPMHAIGHDFTARRQARSERPDVVGRDPEGARNEPARSVIGRAFADVQQDGRISSSQTACKLPGGKTMLEGRS